MKTNLRIEINIKTKLLLIAATFMVNCYTVKATNYYVSNSGSDSNSGLNLNDAFLTIQHAADLVMQGDTIFVADGTYAGFDLRNKSGVNGSPIVFKATGVNVLINQSGYIRDDGINIEDADYIVIDGFIVNDMTGTGNGIRLANADNCVIRNCSCNNNSKRGIFTAFTDNILIENNICTNSILEHGIYVSNSSDNPVIRYNECYGNNGAGIHMNGDLSSGGDGVISNAIIYGNKLHDNNGAAGINMDGLENPVLYNNLIYNNHYSQGMALFQQDGAIVTSGAKIYNNTIIVPSDGRWGILLKGGANINTKIYNNIIINQHTWRGCIAIENTSSFTSNYNILNDKMSVNGDGSSISLVSWQNYGFDSNSQLAGSLSSIFIDYLNNNYDLVATSQAIDTGTNLVSSLVTDDINENPRPIGGNYDIGAYEYQNPSSINNVINTEELKIYPNPFVHYIEIEGINFKVKVSIFELSGELIKTFDKINLPVMLNLNSLKDGIYLIKISNDVNKYPYSKILIKNNN